MCQSRRSSGPRTVSITSLGVAREEFEEVCFGPSLVLRAKATGPNPVYYVLGETDAGRRLFCVVIEFP
jgi:hypothetical protein